MVERRNSALGNGRILWFESDGGLMAFLFGLSHCVSVCLVLVPHSLTGWRAPKSGSLDASLVMDELGLSSGFS